MGRRPDYNDDNEGRSNREKWRPSRINRYEDNEEYVERATPRSKKHENATRVRLTPQSPDWQPNLGPRHRTVGRVTPQFEPVRVRRDRDYDYPPEQNIPEPESYKPQKQKAKGNLLREVVQTVVLAVVIFFVINAAVDRTKVDGKSMTPTLATGQYLITNKLAYMEFQPGNIFGNSDTKAASNPLDASRLPVDLHGIPTRGDIIVFIAPPQPTERYIKRVIGLPGETVEIRNGLTYINDTLQDEPYVYERFNEQNMPARVVPPGNLFVMGDNRVVSYDSREWGFLPIKNVIGRALIRYWPFWKMSIFSSPYDTTPTEN